MAEARVGKKFSPRSEETKQKISSALKNKPKSEEAKRKLSESARARLSNPENHPMYGKHQSEESNLKKEKTYIQNQI